jgi:hypothetical protein
MQRKDGVTIGLWRDRFAQKTLAGAPLLPNPLKNNAGKKIDNSLCALRRDKSGGASWRGVFGTRFPDYSPILNEGPNRCRKLLAVKGGTGSMADMNFADFIARDRERLHAEREQVFSAQKEKSSPQSRAAGHVSGQNCADIGDPELAARYGRRLNDKLPPSNGYTSESPDHTSFEALYGPFSVGPASFYHYGSGSLVRP